jgi:hypothetical protein
MKEVYFASSNIKARGDLGKGSLGFKKLEKVNKEILSKIIAGAKDFPLQFSKKGDSTK